MINNMDAKHFVFNMDNGHTLGFKGELKVNFVELVSCGQKMTLFLRIYCVMHSKFESHMWIFCKERISYAINGVPDTPDCVSYRSNASGWISNAMFVNFYKNKEPRGAVHKTHYFMDKCSGHNESPAVLSACNAINDDYGMLPSKLTHLCQILY